MKDITFLPHHVTVSSESGIFSVIHQLALYLEHASQILSRSRQKVMKEDYPIQPAKQSAQLPSSKSVYIQPQTDDLIHIQVHAA